MPGFSQSLQGRDLGHLRIVAELWGVELNAPDTRIALQRLEARLLDPELVIEVISALPAEARAALDDLLQSEGRMPWALFTRRYGSLREMGPGRRDRDRPHLKPASPAEMLWFRALVARIFFDTDHGPEEFAYVPDDLIPLLPPSRSQPTSALGRPATPTERAVLFPACDRILDHACTLLAALRVGFSQEKISAHACAWDIPPLSLSPYPLSAAALQQLLSAASLIDAAGIPQPEPARLFLEAPRGQAMAQLAQAWLHSPAFNELRLIPGLLLEGEWQNDALRTRQTVLDFLSTLPPNTWWSLTGFISAIRQSNPDFQRPAGDYDSWFIRDQASGEYLRGFLHWDEVDGALLRYLISGPLHWLGMLDLAAPASDAPPSAFRFSAWAASLLRGEALQGLPAEEESLLFSSDARLRIPRLAPRAARYQMARFCSWEDESEDGYRYRITPSSLEQARQQGLTLAHLMALVRRHCQAVPPSLVKALERWDQHGAEVHLEQVLVLRVSSPDLLQALRKSRAARFLGDPLGPTSIVVKVGAMQKVLATLAEMGYLGEGTLEDPKDPKDPKKGKID